KQVVQEAVTQKIGKQLQEHGIDKKTSQQLLKILKFR
ncbi:unnamed protein product, partial [marine sediment metagenome]